GRDRRGGGPTWALRLLAQTLGLGDDAASKIPSAEVYIRQGDVIARNSSEAHATQVLEHKRTHRFCLLAQAPRVATSGGTMHVASVREYPISTMITGVITKLKP